MKKGFLLYCCLLLLLATYRNDAAYAQSFNCPEIEILGGSDTVRLDCTQSCTTLTATLPDIRQTINGNNAYIVEPVPFSAAQPFTLTNPNTIFVNIDDRYSGIITLPFTFCFYGASYNSLVIGANGTISFNTGYANTNSGFALCNTSNNTHYTLPQPNRPSFPLNAIYALFHDINPAVQNGTKKIEWQVTGTAPCRRIIINWVDISQYDCTNLKSTFQCVLYENTNVIDVFVKEKPVCGRWNCGVAAIGLQNDDGSQSISPPNRNTSVFTITTANSEGWRFIPNGASLLVNNQVSLFDQNNVLIQTVNPAPGSNGVVHANFTAQLCLNGNETSRKFYVKANYMPCSGSTLAVLDSVILQRTTTPYPTANDTTHYCINEPAVPLTAGGTNLLWYTSPSQTQGSATAPTPATSTPGMTTYYVTQTIAGCESGKRPLYVLVTDYTYHTLAAGICQGDSFLFNNTYYKTPVSNIKDTFSRPGRCDSIVTLNLTVTNATTVTVSRQLCSNSLPYTWNGISVTQGGNNAARFTTTGSNGCDSTTILNLTVNPVKRDTVTISICETRLPYSWLGNTVTQGGTGAAQYNGITASGCDSILVLNLRVSDTFLFTESVTVCYSSMPYTWRGITVTQGGNNAATRTYTSSKGCDSTFRLNLDITNAITHTVSDSICETALPYTRNGHTISTPGLHTFTDTFLSTGTNCDSIVTTGIFVKDTLHTTAGITICASQLPYTWNGITLNAGGQNVATYTTSGRNGCDSIVHLNLDVNPVVYHTAGITICQSQLPYTWNGISVTQGGNNVATYTTTSATTNCDSIVTLNLTVINTLRDTVSLTACENGFPFTWNGISVTSGGNNIATYTTTSVSTNCDSIVTLNVSVLDTILTDQAVTICQVQLPFTWNNIVVSTGGNNVARFTTTGSNGCDSTTRLNLAVVNTITYTQTLTICQTQLPYTWNNITVSREGNNVAQFTTQSASGCDSITTLNLNVTNTVQTQDNRSICNNMMPFTWNGITVTQAGQGATVYHTTSVRTGCDSIVTLNLSLKDTFSTVTAADLCYNQLPYRFGSITITQAGTYNSTFTARNGCDSIVRLTVRVSDPPVRLPDTTLYGCGSVTFKNTVYSQSTVLTDTTKNANGCDSSYQSYSITVYPVNNEQLSAAICEGASYRFEGIDYTSDTTFTETFTNSFGCDSQRTFTLVVHPRPALTISTNTDSRICLQDELVLTAAGADAYSWYLDGTFHSNNNPYQTVVYTEQMAIKVTGTNGYNCTDSASIILTGEPCCEIGLPNAFSPNGDGLNDYFGLITPGNPKSYLLNIYDRWGTLVFTTTNVHTQWDGTVKGSPSEMGVYFYYVEYECQNGTSTKEKGDITLIR